MKFFALLVAAIVSLAATQAGTAASLDPAFQKQVEKRIDSLRYHKRFKQSLYSPTPRVVVVNFDVMPDGSFDNASIRRSQVSGELGKILVDAIKALPKVQNSTGRLRFTYTLSLGGPPNQSKKKK